MQYNDNFAYANNQDDREMVELFFSAKKLKNKDGLFGVSDPRVVVEWKRGNYYQKIGQTEAIKNDANPYFKTAIDIPFIFEEHQYLRIIVEDEDGAVDDVIGTLDLELGHIIGAGNMGYKGNITSNGRITGEIEIKYQKLGKDTEEYFIDLR